MKQKTESQGKTERVFLVGVELKKKGALEVNESMEELGELAKVIHESTGLKVEIYD